MNINNFKKNLEKKNIKLIDDTHPKNKNKNIKKITKKGGLPSNKNNLNDLLSFENINNGIDEKIKSNDADKDNMEDNTEDIEDIDDTDTENEADEDTENDDDDDESKESTEDDIASFDKNEAGDDAKNKEKENMDYDDDKCPYNFVDDNSEEEETEIIFDDDIIPEISDIVLPEQRKSKPFLTKYERVRLLGDRTQQLTLGAKPMVKVMENLTPKQIAELELLNNVIPLIIQRPLPNGKKERWYVRELKK